MRRRMIDAMATVVAILAVTVASTQTVYVAPKDSPDYGAAEALGGAAVESSLHKGLTRAAELLNDAGARTVQVLVAEGEYKGKLGAGIWEVPVIKNPESALQILGGHFDGFGARDPFAHPTRLVTSAGRNGAFITLGKNSELAQVVISGLVMDAAPSNAYDDETVSLLRDRSRTYPLVSFGYLKTDSLIVADNVFINGAHGVFEPLVVPLTAEATIEIRNNFLLNNVKTMQIGAAITPVKSIQFRGNTVVLNWPYNPDPTSGIVGAISLHNKNSANQLVIEKNLFAYNVGGALQHDWPEERMPEVIIRDNLFYRNAALFGNDDPAAGVIVGKFGTNPTYLVLDLDTVESDLDYTVEGNYVGDPGIDVTFGLTTEEDDDDVNLSGFAPKMELHMPVPTDENARGYGASSDRIFQP